MKDTDITLAKHITAVVATTAAAIDMAKILDVKYQEVDLRIDAVEACDALDTREKETLFHVLKKHEELYGGTLGMWKNFQYDIGLQDSVKPYHRQPYTVPKLYKATLCTE
eukprot:10888753-Ditylum_brightwellii.AAC.1